jgi:hypothetical protein
MCLPRWQRLVHEGTRHDAAARPSIVQARGAHSLSPSH